MRMLVFCLLAAGTLTAQTATKWMDCGLGTQRVRSANYKNLIEPLLRVSDFRMHYFDDGAADATVTCPDGCGYPPPIPVAPVTELMKNPKITVPLLIDCLDDGRRTSARFDGNVTTYPMRVPVGYVCLDILRWRFDREPIAENDCQNDGLGACVNTGYYFRPDDYTHCIEESCDVRPWVQVVQRHWRDALLAGRWWKAQHRPSR
jgi:hypothetical protein